jgi:6-phosphogluconolactonase
LRQEIKVFDDEALLARHLVGEFKQASIEAHRQSRVLNIALSGGNTPRIFLEYLADKHIKEEIRWSHTRLFWGDERMVPAKHPDSNYGMTVKTLLEKISIPEENVHRIFGESKSQQEVKRYAREMFDNIPTGDSAIPEFDWIFLGVGSDGHTASIFPKQKLERPYKGVCAFTTHPQSGQRRITLTMKVINNAKRVSFLVTGRSKAKIVASILNAAPKSKSYPAAQVRPADGMLDWYLDRPAASLFFDNLVY